MHIEYQSFTNQTLAVIGLMETDSNMYSMYTVCHNYRNP